MKTIDRLASALEQPGVSRAELDAAADALRAQAASLERLTSNVALAYGHLWHVNNEPMAPIPLRTPDAAAYEARKLLRDLLTTEQRGHAINAVQALIAAKAA